MEILPSFTKAMKYLDNFKEFFKPKSVIENEEGNIVNILMDNDTYLPVLEEKIKVNYQILKQMIFKLIKK